LNEFLKKVQPESIPGQAIYRALVCRPNHRLGNMLLLTPLIVELERLYSGAEIDIVTEGDIATEVFSAFSSIKNVYFPPKRGFKRPISFLSMLFPIRMIRCDLIIDPCVGSNFSRILTRIFKAKYKLGFDDPEKRSVLTHAVPDSMAPRHMAIRPISLVRWYAGTDGRLADLPPMDIRLTDAERKRGRLLIRELLPDSFRAGALRC
jgi:heptosyltransferase-3